MNSLDALVLPQALIVLLLASILTIYWTWQLIRCYRQEPDGINKVAWLVFIALTHSAGATVYLLYRLIYKRRDGNHQRKSWR